MFSRKTSDIQTKVHASRKIESGEIVAMSHNLGPQQVAFWKENPRDFQIFKKIQIWLNIMIWPDRMLFDQDLSLMIFLLQGGTVPFAHGNRG